MSALSTNRAFSEVSAEASINPAGYIVDYSHYLDTFKVHYITRDYYYHVGETIPYQGWIIHLTSIRTHLTKMFDVILPLLIMEHSSFKIIQNLAEAKHLLDGSYGSGNIGKIVSIYTRTPQDAVNLAKKLIPLTKHFKGPAIPTDVCLSGIVYTQYASLESKRQNIPFLLPAGISWPFQEISSLKIAKQPKMLKFRYYPVTKLKADAKGFVFKALYLNKFWTIKPCIIKQGRQNMISDDYERDMLDRLQWQFDLYHELQGKIYIPRIFDFFKQNGDGYLVMEFFDGITFTELIHKSYKNRTWYNLSQSRKLLLINYLLRIVDVIQGLHENGFVHRDISPDNLLIDKKENICLIDMELTWSLRSRKPSPPFQIGTPGFISPEQSRADVPTLKEDIYALGGLMIFVFTNLFPTKFLDQTPQILQENLLFFVQHENIVKLICGCRHDNPSQRPEMNLIKTCLNTYQDEIREGRNTVSSSQMREQTKVDLKQLQAITIAGFKGLCNSTYSNSKKHWLSIRRKEESEIGNEQREMTLYHDWHTGIAGPLWLIGIAKNTGLDINPCAATYYQNWEYLRNSLTTDSNSKNLGLYTGVAGISLAISEGLNSGLLEPNESNIEILKSCFSQLSPHVSIAEGLAGQGLALLKAKAWLKELGGEEILFLCIEKILSRQQKDGTWNLATSSQEDLYKTEYNIDNGVAGIIWFLLAYIQQYPNSELKLYTEKALNNIITNTSKRKPTWYILKRERQYPSNIWNATQGRSAFALLLIKAFEILKKEHYRLIAETYLKDLPEFPVRRNLTIGNGLAGVGELYLEAAEVFKNSHWHKRAEWIAQLLIHTAQSKGSDEIYWTVENSTLPTADLFQGNAGILHFLMRFLHQCRVNHPLWPGID